MSTNIRIKRICQHCGNEFEAQTTLTKYCSHVCNSRAYKANKRAAKVEVSNEQTRRIVERPVEVIRSKDFLNVADTCKLLGLSRWTVWRAVKAGNINAVKVGRRTVIRRSDIDRLFDHPAQLLEQAQTAPAALIDCYTIKEVLAKYAISDKALYEIIRRNEIPKQYKGKFGYVPKARIDALLNPTNHD